MSDAIQQDTNPFSVQNMAHFGGNAVNSALFNAGDLIPGVKSYLQDPRYKTASDVGGVGGLLGSLLIPGGILVKGLGTGAKAVGAAGTGEKLLNLSKFMSGAGKTDALTNLGRGALVGTEQALPRAAIATTPQGGGEDLGTAALQTGLGATLGGGLGVLGGAASKGLQKVMGTGEPGGGGWMANDLPEAASKETANQAIGGFTGGGARAVRQSTDQLQGYGPFGKLKAVDDAKQNFTNLMAKQGLKNNEDIEQFQTNLNSLFDDSRTQITKENTPFFIKGEVKPETGESTGSLPDWLTKSDDYKNLEVSLSHYGDGEGIVKNYMSGLQNLFDKADEAGTGKSPVNFVMDQLSKDEKFAINNPNVESKINSSVAGVVKDQLQQHGFDMVKDDPNVVQKLAQMGLGGIDDAKGAYKDLNIWRWIGRMQGSGTQPLFTPNSDTALKQAMGMLGAAGGGAAIGGAAGGYDPSNPVTWAGVGAGFLGGNLAAKGLNTLGNKIIAENALKFNQALQPGAEGQASKVAKNLNNIQAMLRGKTGLQQAVAPAVQNIPSLPGRVITGSPQVSMPAQNNAPAQNAPSGMTPPAQTSAAPIPPDAGLSQAAFPPGITGRGERYENTVEGAIDRLYRQIFFSTGNEPMMSGAPTKQQFAQGLAKSSNNFDPSMMAKLLLPGDAKNQEDFLRSYQKINQLSGLNIQRDLISKAIPVLGGILDPASYDNTLKKLALGMTQPEQSGGIDPKRTQQIYNQLDNIVKGWGSPAQKEGLIKQMLQTNVGPTVNNLQQFGLLDGTLLGQ